MTVCAYKLEILLVLAINVGLPPGALVWQLYLPSPAWGPDGFFVYIYVQQVCVSQASFTSDQA